MAAKGNGRKLWGWARRKSRARSFLYETQPQTAPRVTSSWFFEGQPVGDAGGLGTATGAGGSIVASAGTATGTSYVSGATVPPLSIGRSAIIQLSWRSGSYPVSGTLTTPSTDLTVSSINATTDRLTVTAHGIVDFNGDGPLIWHTEGGTVPGGLTEGAAYYAIIVDANTLKLATTDINATTSTAVNITSAGSGTHYLLRKQDTQINDSTFLVFGVRGTWDIVDVVPQPALEPFDSFGNTLTAVGSSPIAYASYPASKLGLYVSPSRGSVGGAAHTVSLNYGPYTTGGFESDEATVGFVEIQGPADLLAYSHVERTAAATITSASITIAKPARLIALIGGNSGVGQHHAFTFLGGFTKIPGACAEAEITTNGYIQISTAELFVDPGGVATAYTFSANGTSSEGGQMWLLAFAEPDIGTASGSSTVTGVGGSVSAAAGSAAGTASVLGVGESIAAGAGSSTGTGTASGAAASGDGAGAASGTGTATGAGTAIYSSAGSASGTSTPAAVGASTAVAAGSASGTSTPAAVGAATAAGAGAAAGTGSAAAVGAATSAAAGVSAGTSTPTAVGASTAAGAGAAAGTSSASAAGASAAAGQGDAAGTAAPTAAGASTVAGAGAASGLGSAAGAGASVAAGAGTAAGTSAATASVDAGIAAGAASGSGTAGATGTAITSAAGDATGSSSAAGAGASTASAAGITAGSSSAAATGAATAAGGGAAAGSGPADAASTAIVSAAGAATGTSTATAAAGAAEPLPSTIGATRATARATATRTTSTAAATRTTARATAERTT